MLLKCCTQYASKFGKLSSGHRTGKGQFSFQSPKQGNAKECSSYCKIALISHASKVMLKILQPGLQQYLNWELPDVQAGFRKGKGTRDHIANICWVIKIKKKKAISGKSIYFYFTDYAKVFFNVYIITNCGKLFKTWEYQSFLPVSWETWSRSNSWNWIWNNRLIQNWKRSPSRLYIFTLLI